MLRVDLRAARIPVVGVIADHLWFVVTAEGRTDRWEVWQRPDAGGQSWGHLHKNLLAPEAGVGWGASIRLDTWTDEAALALQERIETAPQCYPWTHRYHYWPGPNSNTFAQWLLRDYPLPRRAIGRGYARFDLRAPRGPLQRMRANVWRVQSAAEDLKSKT